MINNNQSKKSSVALFFTDLKTKISSVPKIIIILIIAMTLVVVGKAFGVQNLYNVTKVAQNSDVKSNKADIVIESSNSNVIVKNSTSDQYKTDNSNIAFGSYLKNDGDEIARVYISSPDNNNNKGVMIEISPKTEIKVTKSIDNTIVIDQLAGAITVKKDQGGSSPTINNSYGTIATANNSKDSVNYTVSIKAGIAEISVDKGSVISTPKNGIVATITATSETSNSIVTAKDKVIAMSSGKTPKDEIMSVTSMKNDVKTENINTNISTQVAVSTQVDPTTTNIVNNLQTTAQPIAVKTNELIITPAPTYITLVATPVIVPSKPTQIPTNQPIKIKTEESISSQLPKSSDISSSIVEIKTKPETDPVLKPVVEICKPYSTQEVKVINTIQVKTDTKEVKTLPTANGQVCNCPIQGTKQVVSKDTLDQLPKIKNDTAVDIVCTLITKDPILVTTPVVEAVIIERSKILPVTSPALAASVQVLSKSNTNILANEEFWLEINNKTDGN